jgi:F-type H+-transporting ATPase subunit b
MEVNWFTVIAQILNFFLLVWLLKRFLYKPILEAISTRENKIVAQLNDAKATKAAAAKERENLKQKNATFDEEKKAIMEKYISESEIKRTKLFESARTEAEELKKQLEKAAREKQKDRDAALVHKIQEEVFAVSRKTLSDLSSVSLEVQATTVFINRLNDLKDDKLSEFKNAFKNGNISLRSAFPLPKIQQNLIEERVNTLLEITANFKVEVTPELIGGIELSTGEYKLSWSIESYLNTLEDHVLEKSREAITLS